jgi:histone H3/H4
MSELDQVVESPGRLGALIAVMKLAANVATKAGRKTIAEEDVIASINWRKNNLNERFINPKKGK